MRVVVIVPKINLETGGGSHWTLYLVCRGLQELGAEVTVCSLAPTADATADAVSKLGVRLVDLPRHEGAGADVLQRTPADTFLAYGPLSIAFDLKRQAPGRRVAAYLNTLSGFCTNVLEQRDGCWLRCSHLDRVNHHPGRMLARLGYAVLGAQRVAGLRRGYQALDAVVFDSPPLREAYGPIYELPSDRCHVIPECIDFGAMNAAGESRARARADGTSYVVFVGSLAEYKGVRLLFEALRQVRTPWRLSVFGDGPDRPHVEAFRDSYRDRVEYHGHVDNRTLGTALAGRPFVFVHSGLWFEAFGRAVVEAMALGIPVIVPDVGGPAWIVEDNVSGLHYRHRDARDLARKIEWTAAHPGEMDRLAASGRRVAARFDYRVVARRWSETLEGIGQRQATHA